MNAPIIYQLHIERFRGIEALAWRPARGVNIILGGGDVGKTTVLDAIALLLSPTYPTTLSDSDYNGRDIEAGFVIEAVFSLPCSGAINQQTKSYWPWDWNGKDAVVPNMEERGDPSEPFYRLRVRGTSDFELVYEIVQPNGDAETFPTALRRNLGLVRLSGDDRNDRDLRLVQGSALDRLVSDRGLRSRLTSQLTKRDVKNQLATDKRKVLEALDLVFKEKSLPHRLDLAITGSQGLSVTALIGLTADRGGVQLPLASWGAGTRRVAALTIAEQNQGEAPITIVDEIERGLEPYRQRVLMQKLQDCESQVFITTHSPSIISATTKSHLWYVDHSGNIGSLDSAKIATQRKNDPETFRARLTIVAEGATEVGLVTALLEKALQSSLEEHGVHVTDGCGHEPTLNLLEALSAGGLHFGGFVDNEGSHPTRWQNVQSKLDMLLYRWKAGCTEENVIDLLPDDKLEALLTDAEDERRGMRLRTLADRLEIKEKDFQTITVKAGSELKKLIIDAALGTVPENKSAEKKEFQSHGQRWFKSVKGGRELAEKIFSLGIWPTLQPQLMPFLNAVRIVVGLEKIRDLQQ